jgi:hypothetical protein
VFDGGASGAAATGPALACAVADPAELVAVTVTVTVCPTSAADRVSVAPVVPSLQLYR